MKTLVILGIVLLAALAIGCHGSTQPRVADSTLTVFVNWNGQGVEGRKLEILETSAVAYSDSTGHASFELPAGHYTVRAYVWGPGPAGYQDFGVRTQAGEETTLPVADCPLCL